ncbi:MAG: hypothetical protein PUD52_08790 [Prevotella sp.]|nr:hypothetical protein [Prevotella sp.]
MSIFADDNSQAIVVGQSHGDTTVMDAGSAWAASESIWNINL